jgi:hypothetical protein
LGIGLLTGGAWLIGTASGTRSLLQAVSAWTPVKIDVGRLSGRLADELFLEGVNVSWPQGEAV